jgi:N-carbamoyl-L-amino-acid hydrolase
MTAMHSAQVVVGTPSTDFAPALRDRLAAVLAYGDSHPAPVLPTGAGHAEPADCLAGVAALALATEAPA